MTLAAVRIDTHSRGRIVRSALFALAALALLYAPALVADIVISGREPISFSRAPWRAWAFSGAVLRASLTAQAASPGEALTRANSDLQPLTAAAAPAVTATGVELLYLPGHHRVQVTGADGVSHAVDPDEALVWLVRGRRSAIAPQAAIGILDFRSGDLVQRWTAPAPTRTAAKRAA